ncbi:hypothetical protein OESDEN_16191 [Oesophagostomum dentatum]|uniref:MADF domain-containing protein n=1 Tax=Oesophagostomum dentatum TaxID=61180 RepID=A0A0B1SGR5_OESDE|nr:hypothetical protein OESDEN_16191 [Oesophagostomum dentatum]
MLLIELVREQEAIWNPNAPSYSRAELKFEAWRRVQDQMRLKGFDFTGEISGITFLCTGRKT